MEQVMTVCCYCGCGCGLYLQVEQGRVIGVQPSRNHPVSRGNLCVKGWRLPELFQAPDRLHQPLVRRDGALQPATWDEALDLTAAALAAIRDQHGGDRLGVMASAKCTNEENYLLQKFARGVLGTNNIDHCARL